MNNTYIFVITMCMINVIYKRVIHTCMFCVWKYSHEMTLSVFDFSVTMENTVFLDEVHDVTVAITHAVQYAVGDRPLLCCRVVVSVDAYDLTVAITHTIKHAVGDRPLLSCRVVVFAEVHDLTVAITHMVQCAVSDRPLPS